MNRMTFLPERKYLANDIVCVLGWLRKAYALSLFARLLLEPVALLLVCGFHVR
jgi:hypothetical protein